jgi:DNA-binding XRE family transcriptional regulator
MLLGMSKRADPVLKQRLAERLRSLREERHLTQDQLAELTGIEQGTISAIESGRRGMGIEVLCALFWRIPGVSLHYMIGEDTTKRHRATGATEKKHDPPSRHAVARHGSG